MKSSLWRGSGKRPRGVQDRPLVAVGDKALWSWRVLRPCMPKGWTKLAPFLYFTNGSISRKVRLNEEQSLSRSSICDRKYLEFYFTVDNMAQFGFTHTHLAELQAGWLTQFSYMYTTDICNQLQQRGFCLWFGFGWLCAPYKYYLLTLLTYLLT